MWTSDGTGYQPIPAGTSVSAARDRHTIRRLGADGVRESDRGWAGDRVTAFVGLGPPGRAGEQQATVKHVLPSNGQMARETDGSLRLTVSEGWEGVG